MLHVHKNAHARHFLRAQCFCIDIQLFVRHFQVCGEAKFLANATGRFIQVSDRRTHRRCIETDIKPVGVYGTSLLNFLAHPIKNGEKFDANQK